MALEKTVIIDHLEKQIAWSRRTFGDGPRTKGIIEHIRKELLEIEAEPRSLEEWIDVVILGLDGAWRAGYRPDQIVDMLRHKQAVNERRTWPNPTSEDVAIEHVREDGQPSTCHECGEPAARLDSEGQPHCAVH